MGHYARDCQQPQRTNRNDRRRTYSPGRSPVRRVHEDQEDEFQFHSTPNGKELMIPKKNMNLSKLNRSQSVALTIMTEN